MHTTWIALALALIMAVGLVASIGILSLVSGSVDFFIGKPKLTFLKSNVGQNGFAFLFRFNGAKEKARFDHLRLKLFNPFAQPAQVEILMDFPASDTTFSQDLDLGKAFERFLQAKNFENSQILLEIYSSKDGIGHQYEMKGASFKKKWDEASKKGMTLGSFKKKMSLGAPLEFTGVEKNMVAPPSGKQTPVLKIATNPEYQGTFTPAAAGATAGASAEAKPNFLVKKVWIEPGCIICNACEDIYPEVFHVTSETCIINPGAPLDNGLRMQEAAEACPVEVIKFERAG